MLNDDIERKPKAIDANCHQAAQFQPQFEASYRYQLSGHFLTCTNQGVILLAQIQIDKVYRIEYKFFHELQTAYTADYRIVLKPENLISLEKTNFLQNNYKQIQWVDHNSG